MLVQAYSFSASISFQKQRLQHYFFLFRIFKFQICYFMFMKVFTLSNFFDRTERPLFLQMRKPFCRKNFVTNESGLGVQVCFLFNYYWTIERIYWTVEAFGSGVYIIIKFMKLAKVLPILYLSQTLHLADQNKLFSFGSNLCGQLGLGDQTSRFFPSPISSHLINLEARKSVSAGINESGTILTWGRSRGGILGHKLQKNINISQPTQISYEEPFLQVSCGYTHMAGITASGNLVVWGSGSPVQNLIHEQKQGMRQRKKIGLYSLGIQPTKMPLKQRVKKVACGQSHTIILLENGQVMAWGQGKGLGINGKIKQPTKIQKLSNIVQIASGPDFAMAVDKQGRVFAWGNNAFSQLGMPNFQTVEIPKFTGLKNISQISCGDRYAGAIDKNGNVFTWGSGSQGQLGHGDKTDVSIPKKVQIQGKASQISCGSSHTAVVAEGCLYLTGRGRQGQLGIVEKDQSGISKLTPRILKSDRKVKKVACGGQHTLILFE